MRDFLRSTKLAAPYKWWILLAVLLGAGTIGAGIGLMATAAYLISAAALGPLHCRLELGDRRRAFLWTRARRLALFGTSCAHTVSLRLLAALRVWFYNAFEPLAPARVQQYHSGDLLTRAVADIDALQDFYVRVLAPPLVAIVVALGMGLFLWQFDPRLAPVLLLAWLVAGAGVPAVVLRLAREPAQKSSAQRAAMHTQLVDAIQGSPDIAAFGQCENGLAHAHATSNAYASAQMRLAQINAVQAGISQLLPNLTLLALLGIGITAVNAEEFSGVYLATIALATVAAFEAVTPLPQAAQSFEHALAAARRLFEIVDAAPLVQAPPPAKAFAQADSTHAPLLEIRDLKFAYAPHEPNALDGISLCVRAGQKLAIVGPSGAGKSTLVNLLLRFWEYHDGDTLLNGKSLQAYAQADVRAQFGVITQRTYLFNATVRANLQLAQPQAKEREIIAATQRAQIYAKIETLPQGFDTRIGERGAALSGGERQRLGVARALLRATPILILDEPTANLDAPTERALLQEIFQAMQGHTLLLITHRLVALEAMDEIIVMNQGRITERGTQAELLTQRGLFARMWELQNAPFVE
ncbi:MAG: thiol reductant ABC exporter subunit CydC [Chloroflexi bacterium]|nr:thiol reductant ABC exporter subunit CydC [Chloroflexota bacterium]